MADEISITILKDGTLKIETDKVSAPNHMTAEAALRNIAQAMGGQVTITHKHGAHKHMHTHDHVHQ